MPTKITRRGSKWCVVEKRTGIIKSRHVTKGKAQASAAARGGHPLSRMRKK